MFGFFGSSQEMQPPASLKHSKSGLGVPASYMEERSLTLMENHHTQCKTHPEHPVAPLYQVAKQSNLPEAILWHVTFYVKTKLLSCFFSMLFFFPSKWIHQNHMNRTFLSTNELPQCHRPSRGSHCCLRPKPICTHGHRPHVLGSPNDGCTIGSHPRKVGFQSLQAAKKHHSCICIRNNVSKNQRKTDVTWCNHHESWRHVQQGRHHRQCHGTMST